MTGEEWRPIPGYPGYEASNLGRVRSIDRIVTRISQGRTVHQPFPGRILRPAKLKNGYLHCGAGKRDLYVHRAVCLAWWGEPEGNLDAAHYNGIRDDNRPENLRWATRAENFADCIRHGTRLRGARQNGAKLTDGLVAQIRAEHATGTRGYIKLARAYGVGVQTIANVVRGRTWQHVPIPDRPVPARMEGA